MAKPVLKKIKPLIFLLLILTPTILTLSFLRGVKAEVSIISVTPSSGYVGDTVLVIANITTESGSYGMFLDQESVYNGTAIDRLANASFSVPHAVKGVHNVTVKDDTSEASAEFTVLTNYSIETDAPEFPEQLQENDTINISLNLTGGESDATYFANVTVKTPTNVTYSLNASLTGTSDLGHYTNTTIDYPSTQWTQGANTNFTGTYTIFWSNGTEVQATETFFVGLTDSSRYHRGDSVDIKAVDYPPDQNVTILISGLGVSYSENLTAIADADGVVHYTNWTIPQNAIIGNYTLSITPVPESKKPVNDTQTFEVPGFKTEIFTRNLANRTVSSISVRAFDNATSVNYTSTSGSNGSAYLMLEIGYHNLEAFFKEVRVGEMPLTITIDNATLGVNFTCQLTTANIDVIDTQNVKIPFVSIDLTYNYTTTETKANRTGTDSGETNITGTLQLTPLLPNIPYTINASRYGKVFNTDNNTIDLPAEAYENITILCPARKLQVQVIDANNQPIVNAIVQAQELMGGLDYDNATDISGTAILECTFGKYGVKVYQGEITLNETTFDLFEDQNKTIKCQLYGLTVSIKVVDFFGQSISKANVTLQREGLAPRSILTETDGKATFDSVIGGSLQIAIYIGDQTQSCVTQDFYVDNSTTIEIKIEKYVLLAGLLVETSQLATVIIILVMVILILLVEVYRRKRLKPEKSSS